MALLKALRFDIQKSSIYNCNNSAVQYRSHQPQVTEHSHVASWI